MKMINLIMVGLIVFLSCANPTKETTSSTEKGNTSSPDTTETQLTWSELFSGNECSIKQPENLVITSQKQFDSLLSKAFKGDMQPKKSAIDFSKNSVIALFLGTVNSGGHSIGITSIKHSVSNGYNVEAEHKLPGKSCISSTAIEFPYYIALTETAISGKTNFTIKKKEVECE